MPQYQAVFTIADNNSGTLVLRFYQAWGDGSRTGWQTPVTSPLVTVENMNLPLSVAFAYSDDYSFGSNDLGYDQYAQYLVTQVPAGSLGKKLIITGSFQQVAYLSAVIYAQNGQQEILDKDMITLNTEKNPYLEGNPSVFSYSPASVKKILLSGQKANLPRLAIKTNASTGQINVYRLDQYDSAIDVADDIAPDGCSRAYLYAEKDYHQAMIILRIKVPTTFIDSDHPDQVFGHYQTRYLSVGSHRMSGVAPYLRYWTVNARMLKDYMDEEGYAYVFFAPNSYANALAIQQQTPDTQPPVMTWGKYKGYLLGNPDYAIIIRYRDPDPAWQGSPQQATCYATPDALQPVTKEELGDYLPEIYGDTMENFLNGHIGLVNNMMPWPSSLTA
ncbi:MAG: hypothetical protein EPO11_11175 [Gammaproteobacteria bacterium]|nr:MAG: hypothetical protein EPO11_11175 [Gammaproteobacteria bacterium]